MLDLNSENFNLFRDRIINIALLASNTIMKNIDAKIRYKSDGTPVTDADIQSDKIVTNQIELFSPDIPIVSEEKEIPESASGENTHWLVDPLDGTKSFIEGGNDFVVCIALIKKQVPIFGCIAHPPSQKVWIGGKNMGSYIKLPKLKIKKIFCRDIPAEGPTIATSRHHIGPKLKEWLEKIQYHKTVSKGSAIKFALVAEGKLDIYPRTSPTYEWDSAAGQAIVEGSGGKVLQLNNKKLIYGRSNRLNPNFVAFGRSNWSEFLLE